MKVERRPLAAQSFAAKTVLLVQGLALFDLGVGVAKDGLGADPDGEGVHVAAAAKAADVDDDGVDVEYFTFIIFL